MSDAVEGHSVGPDVIGMGCKKMNIRKAIVVPIFKLNMLQP